nr:MAG TPA: hypothetical protein [Caudoviricetes sp.]
MHQKQKARMNTGFFSIHAGFCVMQKKGLEPYFLGV